MDIKDLEPDSNGQFSVCMPTEFCPTLNKMELMAIFNQAGSVQKCNITDNWVFIRYPSKDDIATALILFGKDYNLRVARSSKKELEKIRKSQDTPVKTNGLITNDESVTDVLNEPENLRKKDQRKPDKNDQMKEKLNNSSWLERKVENSKVPVSNNGLSPGPRKDINQDFQNINSDRFRGGKKLFNNTKDELHRHKNASREKDSDQAISRLSIFVSNIESKDHFNELIKTYEPKSVVIKGNEFKMFAFVEMKDEAIARTAINYLDGKKQKTKFLKAQYQRVNRKYVETGEASASQGHLPNETKKSISSPEMPPLETNYSEMPALVPESAVGNDLEKYQLGCCIFVANFPTCSLESTLRKTFEKFHVLDICMVNNQPGSCTKAFLYLATVYDVIAAVNEMNSSCVLGLPLKVAVPFKNGIVNFLMNKIAKQNKF